jgi:hypothetical protein
MPGFRVRRILITARLGWKHEPMDAQQGLREGLSQSLR